MSVIQVTEEQRIKVLEAIGKTPECFVTDIRILREWMKTQTHLPEIMSDNMIGNFLILNKGSVEIAKEKIDMYYTIRPLIPDIFDNLNPKLQENINYRKCGKVMPFPKLTPDLHRVIFATPHSAETMKLLDFRRLTISIYVAAELRMHEDCSLGDIYVMDCNGFTLGDIKKITPTIVAKAMAIAENVYSMPIKGIYFINSPPYIVQVVSLMKRILKPKIFDRIKVYEDGDVLKELFPKEILPEDLGGTEMSLEDIWVKVLDKLDEYQGRFDKLDRLKVDEGFRPNKLRNDDILGYYGNFKKLDVD